MTSDSNKTRPIHAGFVGDDHRAERLTGDCVIGIAGVASTSACMAQNGCSDDPRTIRAAVDVRADNHFERALGACKDGCRITRAGWNASGQHVEAQYPDKGSRMSLPYLVLRNAQGHLVPWVPSQGDLFAYDWAILPR